MAALDELRWGILSTAKIGETLIPAIRGNPGSRIVAVASRTKERAAEWAASQGIERSFGSYEELLADPEVDVIYNPLPTAFHHEWTVKAARAGKHVLCEKPFARTLDEAVDMVTVCHENKVNLMDGVMWSHQPKYALIRSTILNEEVLGEVRSCSAHFAWRQDDPANIRLDKELEPTGCLGDLGWYTIRAILFAFKHELPVSLFANLHRNEQGVIVECHSVMTFANGRFATMGCSFISNENQIFEIHGTKATVRCQDFVWAHSVEAVGSFQVLKPGATVEHHKAEPGPEPWRPLPLVSAFTSKAAAKESTDDWCLLTLKTQAIHDAIIDSAASGQSVNLADYSSRFPAFLL